MCEKPFALNADDARAMIAVADKSGTVMMEGFHYRYDPAMGGGDAVANMAAIDAIMAA